MKSQRAQSLSTQIVKSRLEQQKETENASWCNFVILHRVQAITLLRRMAPLCLCIVIHSMCLKIIL